MDDRGPLACFSPLASWHNGCIPDGDVLMLRQSLVPVWHGPAGAQMALVCRSTAEGPVS